MIRPVTALSALLLAASFVLSATHARAQETRTHEVRSGDTLWELAERYYDDGHLWRRILDANRDRIDDPANLGVGLVLTIPLPGAAEVRGVTVEPPAGPPPGEPADPAGGEPAGQEPRPREAAPPPEIVPSTPAARGPKPIERRTALYTDSISPPFEASVAPPLSAVSRDVVYAAPWLVAERRTVQRPGHLVGFAGVEGDATGRATARPHDRVLVSFTGTAPPVGTLLQVYRPARELAGLGTVVEPTGVVRVESLDPAGAVAVVEKLYQRMSLGDAVGPLPRYALAPGQHPVPVSGGDEVEILGFAEPRPIHSVGDVLFLEAGSGDARLGDEYLAVVSSGQGWTGDAEARLQVVGVHADHVVARITAEESPLIGPGVRVRLDRRMR